MRIAPGTRASILLIAATMLSGCSFREYAASKVGDTLASGGAGWGTDDDPELVRVALPFALKTMESLAAEAPRHEGLRLGLCRGYASYAGGFLEVDADRIESTSFESARSLRERARRMYLRARGYCLEAIEIAHPGVAVRLTSGEEAALAAFDKGEVELLYWSGVAWGSAISLGLDRPELVADLPLVRAIFERALALDALWDRGSLHEAMIVFDSMPAMMGGSPERARSHYEQAIEMSGGRRASPHVTWARSWAVPRQARAEFEAALDRALAVDADEVPADRMLNLISQARARVLRTRAEDFFFEDATETGNE